VQTNAGRSLATDGQSWPIVESGLKFFISFDRGLPLSKCNDIYNDYPRSTISCSSPSVATASQPSPKAGRPRIRDKHDMNEAVYSVSASGTQWEQKGTSLISGEIPNHSDVSHNTLVSQ
jgi:hypothetical protein